MTKLNTNLQERPLKVRLEENCAHHKNRDAGIFKRDPALMIINMFLGLQPTQWDIKQALSERKMNSSQFAADMIWMPRKSKRTNWDYRNTKNSAQAQKRIDLLHVNNNKKVESSSNRPRKHRVTMWINTNTLNKGKTWETEGHLHV